MTDTPPQSERDDGILSRSIRRVRDWLEPDQTTADIDTEYILNLDYEHIQTGVKDDRIRCNLCGTLFDVDEMPDCIDHVAKHDGQGAAEINPVEIAPQEASMDYSTLLTDEETEIKTGDSKA